MVRTGSAGFDERFFLYVEDTDLCYRLSKLGRIRYVPEAKFEHELGSSSASRWRAVALYNRSKELFFEIHFGKGKAIIAFFLNRLGALLRLVFWGLASIVTLLSASRFRQQAGLFWKVLTAPAKGPKVNDA